MDTVTHAITGALVAKSFVPEKDQRSAVLALTLGSIFPDSDTFSSLFIADRLARLEIHRGVTHSFVALPVWALLLGGLTCLGTRQRRWWFYSLLYGIGIALHIGMDVVTSYGTMIWSPISHARIAWDTTFIIDLTFTLIVLLPQWIAWVYADLKWALWRAMGVWSCFTVAGVGVDLLTEWLGIPLAKWAIPAASALIAALLWVPSWQGRGFRWRRAICCRVGVGALAVYMALCGIAHRAALKRVEEFASQWSLTVRRLAAIPAPPSLWRWSGLVETPDGVYRVSIDLARTGALDSQFFANAETNPYLEEAEGLRQVKTYRWFARFPWVTYYQNDGLNIVEYRDIQFFGPFRGSNPPFTYQVFLDSRGRVVRSGLLGP